MNKRAILITPKLGFCYGMTGYAFLDRESYEWRFRPDGENESFQVKEKDLYFPAG